MGVVATVGYDRFPKQGSFLGQRVEVCFNYDLTLTLHGKIVRDDNEEPHRMIIELEDGRYIAGVECQYTLCPC